MNYVVEGLGAERHVEVQPLGDARYRVILDGQAHEVEARPVGPPAGDGSPAAMHLRLGTRSVLLGLHGAGGGTAVQACLDGICHDAEVLSLRQQAERQSLSQQAERCGPQPVAVPMAGKVVSVLVHEGDAVIAGQGLLVVEAMKMENELRAPQAGTVRQLSAAVGGAVESGTVVCTVA